MCLFVCLFRNFPFSKTAQPLVDELIFKKIKEQLNKLRHPLSSNLKSNLHYTRVILIKRVTSGGVHLRSLAPGQHSFEETSQRWRAVGDTVSNLIDPGIEPTTSRADSDVFHHFAAISMFQNGRLKVCDLLNMRRLVHHNFPSLSIQLPIVS